MKSKYIGKIYDGRWKVIRFENYVVGKTTGRFVLKNIYNDEETVVKDATLRRIDRGETTLSVVMSHKIRTSKGYRKPDWQITKKQRKIRGMKDENSLLG